MLENARNIDRVTDLCCPRCGKVLKMDRHRRQHMICVGLEQRAIARMTTADWRAVAGWLNPGQNALMGQMGAE
jgi:hypothetical protein